jgi:hypothetical protein
MAWALVAGHLTLIFGRPEELDAPATGRRFRNVDAEPPPDGE